MKRRLLIAAVASLLPSFVLADGLADQINATLLSHVSAHTQYTTKGENRLALLDDIVEIGKWNGATIGQIRFGFTGITNPDTTVTPGAGYVADIYLNAAPLIRKYVTLNPTWQFLSDVEVGPSFAYDFREHRSYADISVGLAFSLSPHP